MKKLIAIICCLVMLPVFSGFAEEDFVLRNDIRFGDNVDTVKSKETLELTDTAEDLTYVKYKGTVAGMDKTTVKFSFNEESGGLIDMFYDFQSETNSDFADNNYKTLYQSLVRKYGSPLGNTGGNFDVITGSAFDDCISTIGLYMYLLNGSGDLRDYDEWIIESNGYNVKIDLIEYYTRDSDYNRKYYIGCSYHYFTDEEKENKIQEKKEENNAVDNDM